MFEVRYTWKITDPKILVFPEQTIQGDFKTIEDARWAGWCQWSSAHKGMRCVGAEVRAVDGEWEALEPQSVCGARRIEEVPLPLVGESAGAWTRSAAGAAR